MSVPRQPGELRQPDPGFDEALGHAVKVLRTAAGLERKDLAAASGVSYPYLSEIENGKKRPSSRALRAIAEAMGVSLADLMADAESWAPARSSRMLRGDEPPALREPRAFAAAPAAAGTGPSTRRWFRSQPATPASVVGPAPAGREPVAGGPTLEIVALLARLSPQDRDLVLQVVRRLAR